MIIETIFIIIGIITGGLMGIVGIGGGLILLQFLIWAGMTFKQAVAVTLVIQVVPQALPAVYMYYKEGHVKIKETLLTIIGSFIGVTIGAYIANNYNIDEKILYAITSVLLLIGSVYFLKKTFY